MRQRLLSFVQRRLLPCSILLVACCMRLEAQAPLSHEGLPYWQQELAYTIDVALNTDAHTLDGFARIQYTNHSPDTLSFIWFQLWPNAYKNDQTAFSEQLLGNGRTDFYFSDQGKRGYINRLDFRADGAIAAVGDHPQYIDIIKVNLPHPLAPGGRTTISTPFHVQLPFDLSRGGYAGGNFQIADWYPQPAVYDRYGWHPIPYLDQGGSYSEFADFDVRITVPTGYTVATGGEPAEADSSDGSGDRGLRILHYHADHSSSFAWFAAKNIKVDHDTLSLPSGRIVDLYACYRPDLGPLWKEGIKDLKNALRFRSGEIGEYPFASLSLVGVNTSSALPTAYPGLIVLPIFSMRDTRMIRPRQGPEHPRSTYKTLSDRAADSFRNAINHTVGMEWSSCVIGADERRFPWMGDGLSAFYDRISPYYGHSGSYDGDLGLTRSPADPKQLHIQTLAAENKDQPISTSSEDLTLVNYSMIARYKTAIWLNSIKHSMSPELFDSCMRQYFQTWQFRHPYPADFRAVFETISRCPMDSLFTMLDTKGAIPPLPTHRRTRATFIRNYHSTEKYNYLNIGPAAGYNFYDKFMIGVCLHNLDLPPNRLQFLAAPLFGTNSNRLNGLGAISYSWYPEAGSLNRILAGVTGSRFSTISGVDSNGKKISGGFYKVVPTVRISFRKPSPRSTLERSIEWKTFLIGESGFDNYVMRSTDSNYYPVLGKYDFRYLNQLSFYLEDKRVLYPYNALFQFQQGSAWYRVNFTGNYFFNYESGGGLGLRLFAAKFGHIGGVNPSLDLSAFQPKLTGVIGSEDYTYGNYFLGRNEYNGLPSQQIMIRDGGLKIRTDIFQGLQGRSDNWVASVNLNSSLPPGLLPPWLPLKVFLDLGTYAEAWQDNPPTSRFLYVAGLQLTPIRYLTIYAPLFYSGDFSNQLKTLPDRNTFFKKISFSIDFQTISFGKTGVDNPF